MSALRWTFSAWSGVPLVRALWWRFARRYRYEICDDCGRPVGRWIGTWWRADDALWLRINGGYAGALCPRCFTERCDRDGTPIHFVATPELHGRAGSE